MHIDTHYSCKIKHWEKKSTLSKLWYLPIVISCLHDMVISC